MRKCHNCNRSTFDTANFCHHCGAKMGVEEAVELPKTVIEETLICPNCKAENAMDAQYCDNCGHHFFEKKAPPPASTQQRMQDIFEESPNQDIELEIGKYFTEVFEYTIKSEQNPVRYNDYVDRFYESDFKVSFEYRIKQLAEEIQSWRLDLIATKSKETAYLDKAFSELIDYFVVRYCVDLNEVLLPEAILKYQNMAVADIDLTQMIYDYLDFETEEETVYTDFLKMPLKKLRNASAAFLFPEKGEKILFICDQSVLSNAKEGFAMTEKAIYWKMPFENAERVYYKNIEQVVRQAEWMTINGMFFNVNKSINYKVLKVLKKLKILLE